MGARIFDVKIHIETLREKKIHIETWPAPLTTKPIYCITLHPNCFPKYKFLFVVVDKQEHLWFQLTSNCAQLEGVTWSDEIGLIKVNFIVTEKSSVLVGYKKADARSRLKYGFMSKLTLICQI